jgi:hypothetical protein
MTSLKQNDEEEPVKIADNSDTSSDENDNQPV